MKCSRLWNEAILLLTLILTQMPRITGSETSPPSFPALKEFDDVFEGSGFDDTNDLNSALDLPGLFNDGVDGVGDSVDENDEDYDSYEYSDDYDYDEDDDDDDDEDEEDYDDFYDGLNTGYDYYDDGDYSTGNVDKDANAYLEETIMCFRCLGDGTNGCNTTEMLTDITRFAVKCVGKCLNISTGSIAVYDCAGDLATNQNLCLDDLDTRMCFCQGDLCNGPANLSVDVDALISRIHRLNYTSDSIKQHSNGGRDGKNSNHYSPRNSSAVFNTNPDTEVWDTVRQSTRLSNEIPLESAKEKTTIPLSVKQGQRKISTSSVSTQGHRSDSSYQYVSETEIDIIIPGKWRGGTPDNNKSFEDNGSENLSSDDVHSLSAASLRDGSSGCCNNRLRLMSALVFLLATSFRFFIDMILF